MIKKQRAASPAVRGLEGFSSPNYMDLHNFVPQASQSEKFDVFQGTPWGQWLDMLPQGRGGGAALRGLQDLPSSPGITRVPRRGPVSDDTSFYNPLQRGKI